MSLDFLLTVLQRTPPWVFGLFFVLLVYGYVQSRTRSLGRVRLAILPVVMLALSFAGVTTTFGLAPPVLLPWLAGAAAAAATGLLFVRPGAYAYDPATRRITVPGSWIPLALMMTIFFLRYAVTVQLAINPALRQSAVFVSCVALLYGTLSGLFAARALRAWRAVQPQARAS